MRLRLIILLIASTGALKAQEQVRDSLMRTISKKEVDVNFLYSYYQQDGDHSAVTGGTGTQELSDHATKLILNIPLDTSSSLNVKLHVNYYASASTDRINYVMSSASSKDLHAETEFTYVKTNSTKKRTWGVIVGGGIESDYYSGSLGFKWAKSSKDENRELSIQAIAYLDVWRLIFPIELRETAYKYVSTDKRYTGSLSFTYSQVFTKRLTASFTTDFIYHNGLLSTPFHRVYFEGNDTARIEKLPGNRFRLPVGFHLNYFIRQILVTRFNYRFYYDNFGIIASTIGIELPFRIRNVISIAPFYRFHAQTAADYFAEYGKHPPDELFYTSDFDLSSFTSHKVGLALSYLPLSGITKIYPDRRLRLSMLGVRYANYFRSDGLHAFIISFHLGLKI